MPLLEMSKRWELCYRHLLILKLLNCDSLKFTNNKCSHRKENECERICQRMCTVISRKCFFFFSPYFVSEHAVIWPDYNNLKVLFLIVQKENEINVLDINICHWLCKWNGSTEKGPCCQDQELWFSSYCEIAVKPMN